MAENRIITSQFVQIDQTPAGVGLRIFARLIDFVVVFIYSFGLMSLLFATKLRTFTESNTGLIVLCLLLLPVIFYSLLFEIFNNGKSIGKKLLGLRVVMLDGTTPTIGAYFLRWLFLLIDLYISYIGLIIMMINKNNRRFGDLAAGTMVIKENDYRRFQVSLAEFNHLSKNYQPIFPQVENLSLEQISTINEALMRYDSNRARRISTLAEKVKSLLNISVNMNDENLLRTLTRDFQYYALEEI
ncbi:MAG: RDD family protein [Paludibacter sp.]|jgi:uncharacterized RDD family membrane protein YckC|nr:RDD family protein [Paludibacter sp.]